MTLVPFTCKVTQGQSSQPSPAVETTKHKTHRHPNGTLRRQRMLRGWTLDDVAERLHRVAAASGGPEPGVDAHMIGRWERGVRRPTPRYVAMLCELFQRDADELGLVDDAGFAEPKEIDLRRRQFLQYLAGLGGVTVLDWERLAAPAPPSDRVDEHLFQDLRTLTDGYARQVEVLGPQSLAPALRSHLAMLSGFLQASQPPAMRRRLQSLAGETAALAGRLAHLIENRSDAHACWTFAAGLAREAEDGELLAFVLALWRSQHSSIPHGGRGGEPTRAIRLLDEAAGALGERAAPHLRAFVLASRAEDHAAAGDRYAASRDLDLAQGALEAAEASHEGFLAGWDAGRIAGYRGSCLLALDRPEEAAVVLERALALTPARRAGQRSAVLTDLAASYALQREVEHACALLGDAVAVAQRTGLAELVQRAYGVRRHLAPWRRTAAVRELHERFSS